MDGWMEKPEWSAHRESSCGYTKVIATRTKLHVTYIRTDSSIGDDFWISKSMLYSYLFLDISYNVTVNRFLCKQNIYNSSGIGMHFRSITCAFV